MSDRASSRIPAASTRNDLLLFLRFVAMPQTLFGSLLPWAALALATLVALWVVPVPRPAEWPLDTTRARLRLIARRSSVALGLWIAVFLPLLTVWLSVGAPAEVPAELSELRDGVAPWQFFWVHAVLALVLAVFWVSRDDTAANELWQLGLDPRRSGAAASARDGGLEAVAGEDSAPDLAWWAAFGREVGLGVGAGVAAWATVLSILLIAAAVILRWLGPEALPQAPPEATMMVAAAPVLVRVCLALSAGLFEEVFFRGLLQPRIGIFASTVLFVMAHASYGQPLVLCGIGILSLMFAALRRWRGSVYAAVVAHAVFDLVQLLVVLPLAT